MIAPEWQKEYLCSDIFPEHDHAKNKTKQTYKDLVNNTNRDFDICAYTSDRL